MTLEQAVQVSMCLMIRQQPDDNRESNHDDEGGEGGGGWGANGIDS